MPKASADKETKSGRRGRSANDLADLVHRQLAVIALPDVSMYLIEAPGLRGEIRLDAVYALS